MVGISTATRFPIWNCLCLTDQLYNLLCASWTFCRCYFARGITLAVLFLIWVICSTTIICGEDFLSHISLTGSSNPWSLYSSTNSTGENLMDFWGTSLMALVLRVSSPNLLHLFVLLPWAHQSVDDRHKYTVFFSLEQLTQVCHHLLHKWNPWSVRISLGNPVLENILWFSRNHFEEVFHRGGASSPSSGITCGGELSSTSSPTMTCIRGYCFPLRGLLGLSQVLISIIFYIFSPSIL